MPTNRSLWQDKPGVSGSIRESQIPSKLEDSELIVKVHTWAVNPCDAMLQDKSLPFITYPVILGEDVAGTVEVVGSIAASKFKVGDCVIDIARGAVHKCPSTVAFRTTLFFISPGLQDPRLLVLYRRFSVSPLHYLFIFCSFLKALPGFAFPHRQPTSTGKSVLI